MRFAAIFLVVFAASVAQSALVKRQFDFPQGGFNQFPQQGFQQNPFAFPGAFESGPFNQQQQPQSQFNNQQPQQQFNNQQRPNNQQQPFNNQQRPNNQQQQFNNQQPQQTQRPQQQFNQQTTPAPTVSPQVQGNYHKSSKSSLKSIL